jgi:hypothetical protein
MYNNPAGQRHLSSFEGTLSKTRHAEVGNGTSCSVRLCVFRVVWH